MLYHKYTILYATHSILTSKYQICFFWKIAFSSKLLFFQNRGLFFKLVSFHCFSPNPSTRRCVSTIESLSLFRGIVKIIVNYQSDLGFGGFLWFPSTLFILIIYKGNRFSHIHQLVPTYRTVLRTVRYGVKYYTVPECHRKLILQIWCSLDSNLTMHFRQNRHWRA